MNDWRRHALGICGLTFFLVALLLGASSVGGSTSQFALGALVRIGMLLVVLWLALPSLVSSYRYFPKWVWYVSLLALVVAALQRNLLVIVAALFAVLVFFQAVSWFLSGMRDAERK